MTERRIATPAVLGAVVVWLALALGIEVAGLPQRLRPPAPQLLIFGLAAAVVLAGLAVPRVRAWVMSVDPRVLVALHLTRFVGIYFLVLYGRGELPYAFAVPGGWGDIAVATAAVGLMAVRPYSRGVWWAYSAWNVFGLVDILFVVATAARLGLTDPSSMRALLQWPLSLLPTWLVPLIIATHVLLGYRLWRQRAGATV
jgi:hypothetical protein